MPPKPKFTKENIADAAVALVRQSGMEALTARAVAARLGCSPKPIFGLYESMAQLREAVIARAQACMAEYTERAVQSGEYPPYKAIGMAYVEFAREEKELFRLLYMRDRSGEETTENREALAPVLDIIQKNTGLDREKAYLFHIEQWVFVHGIATMLATSYLDIDKETVSSVITDCYQGLRAYFIGGKDDACN